MPLLYGSSSNNDDEQQSLIEQSEARAKRVFAGFIEFAFSGNILEIAFGLILANAFTTVTTSFVNDILLPPLSVLLPLNRNMDEKFLVLKAGPNYEEQNGYNTIDLAHEDGAVILAYGGFIRHVVSFLCLGLMLYVLASVYQYFSKDDIIKYTVKCRYCKKRVSVKATRCINCTSWLDGREERMR
ncbi:large-conductance mechanosensitive channel [Xylaria bambusicola]|uniref:large-conductance mechanosensitive channel n=1 Tax=Xylaria bambusicola TaxID=326684 RepID=UPI002008CCE2|nr:large-conductance mechanosensitive channel [Xylaria bambusicola]KAI0523665.1 large-conductance mechanosensitive channel [Xylaria bambusicola]